MAKDEEQQTSMADEAEMSLDVILSGEGDSSLAEERLGPDERDRLEEKRAELDTKPAEQEPEKDEAPAASEPQDDVPGFLRDKPEDAANWRALRGIAKDAQKAAREAQDSLAAERAKLQAEIAALRAQQSAPVRQAPALPPVDEDPGAHIAALRTEMEAQIASAKYDVSEAAAIGQHGKAKVDEAFAWFERESASDPALAAQMRSDPHPWGFVVQEKARREALAEMGDPTTYRERIEAEAREKVRAELLAEMEAGKAAEVERAIRSRVPTSLATVPAAGNSSTDSYAGPAPMGQILESGLDS